MFKGIETEIATKGGNLPIRLFSFHRNNDVNEICMRKE